MSADYATEETLRILTEARELIATPGGWCRLAYARDAKDYPCSTLDAEAASFCAVGAIARVLGVGLDETRFADDYEAFTDSPAYTALCHAAATNSGVCLEIFNNSQRGPDHVLSAYDRALADVRAQLAAGATP